MNPMTLVLSRVAHLNLTTDQRDWATDRSRGGLIIASKLYDAPKVGDEKLTTFITAGYDSYIIRRECEMSHPNFGTTVAGRHRRSDLPVWDAEGYCIVAGEGAEVHDE